MSWAYAPRGNAWLLAGYLARRYAVVLGLTLLVLAAFIYMMDLLELLRRLGDKNVAFSITAQMSLFKLPSLVVQVLFFGVLMATLVYFQGLAKGGELVALRAAGLPARRFMLPALSVVAAVGVGVLAVGDSLAATLLKRYERWEESVFPGSTRGLITPGGSVWLKQTEGAAGSPVHEIFIYGASIAASGASISSATIFIFGAPDDVPEPSEANPAARPTTTFKLRLDAARMNLEPGQAGHEWVLEDVFITRPQAALNSTQLGGARAIEAAPRMRLPTTLTPTVLQNSFNPPGTLGVWELAEYIKVLQAAGFPTALHRMNYHRALALPGLLIAMFMLAVPLALGYARRHNTGVVLGGGVALGLVFYVLNDYTATFGMAGRLPVALAAWTPTAIALLAGVALLIIRREE